MQEIETQPASQPCFQIHFISKCHFHSTTTKLLPQRKMTEPSAAEDRPLTAEELRAAREAASETLRKLQEEVRSTETPIPPSWVRGETTETDIRSNRCRFFDSHGFYLVPSLANDDMVSKLRLQMESFVTEEWKPSPSHPVDSFATDLKSNVEKRKDYFLDSSDTVHYFAEPQAVRSVKVKDEEEEDGNDQKVSEQTVQVLREDYENDKLSALNKAGHGLHLRSGSAFETYTHSESVRSLVRELGWQSAVVPQSMYIFKQPRIGGTVHSHQDSTFLFTTPRQSCLGVWLALDDATLENGCLWVRPKSHLEPVRRQFIRNPAYFSKEAECGDVPPHKLIFRQLSDDDKSLVPWEGALPAPKDGEDERVSIVERLLRAGFIPVECKAGDAVVFCGTLDHLSLPNTSDRPRHTFQLHLVEGPKAGVTWSHENWLQYPFVDEERKDERVPFVEL